MKSLLEAADLPSYDGVMKPKTKSTYRKIIEPFEKALNNLQNAGLCGGNMAKKGRNQYQAKM
ncbi:hypothetical protein [Candidatus Endomicrobiellum agilis]|jgi:hypothetical protein|uniref:hypothetical protein n=1 Tax=Candidatus Endomicrobiellum agilis TaxID=3238957 RepID=UPI003573AA15|nr:hypothetical protein [Endomicrobium sp.]